MANPLRLLCIFAHPDDEGFGTGGMLVRCVQRGVAVHLLTLTPGDAGEISDPALATPETLGAVRRDELERACEILGAEPPEVLDYRDGKLSEVDPAALERETVVRIRRLRPQIVLTFDANGGYGHPDHIAVHQRTVAAWHAAGDPTRFPEAGLEAHQPAKLYFTAYPRSRMTVMTEALQRLDTVIDFGTVQTIPTDEMAHPTSA